MLFLAVTCYLSDLEQVCLIALGTLIAPTCLTGLLCEVDHLSVYCSGGYGMKQRRGVGCHKWNRRRKSALIALTTSLLRDSV